MVEGGGRRKMACLSHIVVEGKWRGKGGKKGTGEI